MRGLVINLETAPLPNAVEYLEPLTPPANYKQPETIAQWLEEHEQKQRERCSLDPDLARIVAIGRQFEGEPAPHVSLCLNEREERDALIETVAEIETGGKTTHSMIRLITFNGFRFDFPMLMRRADYLGVPYREINIDRYRSPHLDLYGRLTFWGALGFSHSLNFYAKRLGLPVNEEVKGADIPGLVAQNEWNKVRAHCAERVQLTQQIAARLGLLRVRVAA